MPRAGLTADDVVVAGAELADEIGYPNLNLGLVARRLGVRTPSLYKHIDGIADLQHRIATLAMAELGETTRDAVAGRSGRDALAAMATALRGYVVAHPGRYSATVGAELTGAGDPLLSASTRVLELIAAVLAGYGIGEHDMVHVIRAVRCTLHGFAILQATNGFQWGGDIEESFEALVAFIDRGLGGQPSDRSPPPA
jgi:AcrR family transcriptional regulator